VARVLTHELFRHDATGPGLLWVWRPQQPFLAASTAVLGGGLGVRSWVLNASVGKDYAHADPAAHLVALAAARDLPGDGVGLLTAVDVGETTWRADEDVEVLATVGLGWPTWAAAPDGAPNPYTAGTINVVAWVPVRLADGALVNAVATASEAKAQALFELDVPGTGTASDAVAICCPAAGRAEPYGGPRSAWGARLARAVHAAVRQGALAERSSRGAP
jgi:adenosylcobinamide amidohydrolase